MFLLSREMVKRKIINVVHVTPSIIRYFNILNTFHLFREAVWKYETTQGSNRTRKFNLKAAFPCHAIPCERFNNKLNFISIFVEDVYFWCAQLFGIGLEFEIRNCICHRQLLIMATSIFFHFYYASIIIIILSVATIIRKYGHRSIWC